MARITALLLLLTVVASVYAATIPAASDNSASPKADRADVSPVSSLNTAERSYGHGYKKPWHHGYKYHGYKYHGYKHGHKHGYKHYGYKHYGYRHHGYKHHGFKHHGFKHYGYKYGYKHHYPHWKHKYHHW